MVVTMDTVVSTDTGVTVLSTDTDVKVCRHVSNAVGKDLHTRAAWIITQAPRRSASSASAVMVATAGAPLLVARPLSSRATILEEADGCQVMAWWEAITMAWADWVAGGSCTTV